MRLKNVRFMFLLLKICLIFGWNLSAQNLVVLDPGHGGKDTGAIGVNGIEEEDVVLDIANAILKLNIELDKPLEIYLTRYSDTLISLSDRTKLAKALKADLFVSLHCNHSDNPDARGIEVYVSDAKSKYSDKATWIAFQLQDTLNKKLGFESRGVKFANFQVLLETIGYCPSVLLELGFLSNKDESNHCQKPKSYRALALVLLESLIKNLENYERVGN